jgi:hypothetical protein
MIAVLDEENKDLQEQGAASFAEKKTFACARVLGVYEYSMSKSHSLDRRAARYFMEQSSAISYIVTLSNRVDDRLCVLWQFLSAVTATNAKREDKQAPMDDPSIRTRESPCFPPVRRH